MAMSVAAALISKDLDTRARIVETAERLFRDIGYQKTTVADIARELRMSPANVYRFFDSKKAINEAVAERITSGVRAGMVAIAQSDRPAADRLRELLRQMNSCMCQLGATEAKMHDMVEAAMNESWGVIRAHLEKVDEIITQLVADGVRSGEFGTDPETAGPCIRAAMIRFSHPAIIAQCHEITRPTLEEQIEFVLAAVRAR
jgi:AcrR family transcriptional regulator